MKRVDLGSLTRDELREKVRRGWAAEEPDAAVPKGKSPPRSVGPRPEPVTYESPMHQIRAGFALLDAALEWVAREPVLAWSEAQAGAIVCLCDQVKAHVQGGTAATVNAQPTAESAENA